MTPEIEVWVKGIQRYIDDQSGEPAEPVIVHADGKYRFVANKLHIVYDEPVEGSKAVVKNHVVIDKNRVEIHRSGVVEAKMVFENALLHEFAYRTPYGIVPMAVKTESLKAKETEDAVSVHIKYNLIAGGQIAAKCETEMKFKSK